MEDDHLCPECREGKCGNCDGDAWCTIRDAITPCEHDCREPRTTNTTGEAS